MKNMWYENSFIRNLTDMHIPWGEGFLERFDPEAYARNISISGATTAYIYASNCLGLSLYPTDIGLRHSEAEKHDLFGETVSACRRAGLHVVGYLNAWGSFVCDQHPEWSVVNYDGVSMRDGSRYGNPCVNSPYREYFISRVREMCSRYDIDGLWVDMIGIWESVCACQSCREKYRALHARELPRVINWRDPEFIEYIRFKNDSVASFARGIRSAAAEVKPEISVGLQCAALPSAPNVGLSAEYFEAMDYCAGDFYTGHDGVNVISRILYSLTPRLPFEFMTSRCADLSFHTMNKSIRELTLQAFAAFLYNGSFLFIDAIDPEGTMNADFYRSAAGIEAALRPFIPYIDYNEKPLRDIAVYINFDSFINPADNGKPVSAMSQGPLFRRLHTLGRALSSAHLDYDILTERNLGQLSRYRVLILSSLEMMSEKEAEAVRRFTADGGHVYISGTSSLLRSDGALQDNFMLSDVIGADCCGAFDLRPNYILPRDDHKELFGRYNRRYPHTVNEACRRVKPHGDAEIMADVGLPLSDASDFRVFASAISNPPRCETDSPALLFHRYGKGEVIYSATLPEESELYDNGKLFADIIGRLLGERRFTAQAPENVDITAYEGEGRYRVGLLNYQETNTPIPVHDIRFTLRLGDHEDVGDVFTVGQKPVEWHTGGGTLHVRLSVLDVFEMVVITLKKKQLP